MNNNVTWELAKRKAPIRQDLAKLEEEMRISRERDFSEYFNTHRSMPSSKTAAIPKPMPNADPLPPIFALNPSAAFVPNPSQQTGVTSKNYQQAPLSLQYKDNLCALRQHQAAGFYS